ncbi:hypothetical protein EJ07DRAFT_95212 [Lizonia empirigonia]|nr:hypothetical protein EJ07DRAFT_95212 [Lizonia empirigonia]
MLFWRSWQQTFTKELILSAFENTGIWPLNPNVLLSRWDDISDSEYETPPLIKAHDWRSIDRLYKAIVGENTSDDARQLRRTIHHLSASCGILTAENKGLSAAVAAQNPLKKKRETLDLRQRNKGRSEALLYSPSKVRDARHRNRLNEAKRLEEEVAKHHGREERAAARLRNNLERERCSAAYAARLEASRQRRAEEAADRERKKQERDAAKSIQLSQLGKRKASQKAPAKVCTKKSRSARARRGVVEEPPLPSRTVTTRSGRTATRNY